MASKQSELGEDSLPPDISRTRFMLTLRVGIYLLAASDISGPQLSAAVPGRKLIRRRDAPGLCTINGPNFNKRSIEHAWEG
jgi:hypothetical protein